MLYPHARLLRPLLLLSDPRHFDADLDFLSNLSAAGTKHDLAIEFVRFRYHPMNRGWLRRILRLRVSTRRCRELLAESLVVDTR